MPIFGEIFRIFYGKVETASFGILLNKKESLKAAFPQMPSV
jgi:hypothetical protein